MRQCRFCSRYFKNRQAVRRHLGFCQAYKTSDRPETPWTREQLFQCSSCVAALGHDHVERLTRDEMHAAVASYGGCPLCRTNAWIPGGWRRVPKPTP